MYKWRLIGEMEQIFMFNWIKKQIGLMFDYQEQATVL